MKNANECVIWSYSNASEILRSKGYTLHEEFIGLLCVSIGISRKAFLDAWEAKWRGLLSPRTSAYESTIDEKVSAFLIQIYKTPILAEEIALRMARCKREEVRGLNITGIDLENYRKSQVRAMIQQAAGRQGLEVTRVGFRYRVNDHIELDAAVDTGAPGSTITDISTTVVLNFNPGKKYVVWDDVFPGFGYYNYFESGSEAVRGVDANVFVVRAFAGAKEPA